MLIRVLKKRSFFADEGPRLPSRASATITRAAASWVIITDPFWNPYIEMQAVDRVYRIGQQPQSLEPHQPTKAGTRRPTGTPGRTSPSFFI
ncbi:Uncharacterized protein HZ326_25386 [Fusarium oxysporum f. sp. albedinis]|nr:Uncharacterized protein HZ326_25386 [Fusarium oxysporum f. sp. albedinis]